MKKVHAVALAMLIFGVSILGLGFYFDAWRIGMIGWIGCFIAFRWKDEAKSFDKTRHETE